MTAHVFPQPAWQIVDALGADGEKIIMNAGTNHVGGLTKRELFAAMAMQGLASYSGANAFAKDQITIAVMMADALIEDLEKKTEKK